MNKNISDRLKKMLMGFLITGMIAASGMCFADEESTVIDSVFDGYSVVINGDYYNGYDFNKSIENFGKALKKYDSIENLYVKKYRREKGYGWYDIKKTGKINDNNEVSFDAVLEKMKSKDGFEEVLSERIKTYCDVVERSEYVNMGPTDSINSLNMDKEVLLNISEMYPENEECKRLITYTDEYRVKLDEFIEILGWFYENSENIKKLFLEDKIEMSSNYVFVLRNELEYEEDREEFIENIVIDFQENHYIYIDYKTGMEHLKDLLNDVNKIKSDIEKVISEQEGDSNVEN